MLYAYVSDQLRADHYKHHFLKFTVNIYFAVIAITSELERTGGETSVPTSAPCSLWILFCALSSRPLNWCAK